MTPSLRFLMNQCWAIEPGIFASLANLLVDHATHLGSPASLRLESDADGTPAIPGGESQPQIIGHTAIIPVRGVLARYADQINGTCQDTGRSAESLQKDLLEAAADASITRIILAIDSPGGTVAGTAETADVIRQISASGKPVIAFVDGMAASAAYWLASQADEIVMGSATTQVGSIGVITAHVDATRAQERGGYRVQVFRTSPLKAPGAAGESLSKEQAASIDREMSDLHAVFADAVAAGRGLTVEQLAAVTTGEMWTPKDALALGLADRVATLAEILAAEIGSSPDQASTVASPSADLRQRQVRSLQRSIEPASLAQEPTDMTPKQLQSLVAAFGSASASTILAMAADGKDEAAIRAALTAQADAAKAEAAAKALADALADAAKAKADLATAHAELEATKAALAKLDGEAKAKTRALADHAARAPAVLGADASFAPDAIAGFDAAAAFSTVKL